ncbi:Ig-like domain-containing protein [Nocardiopsis sp. NPDC058789]|uniref:L,D-transpeptidase family protein n=1 Tax=Nocardiopsis eucommiae TaxID=2831970 RepID=A0A975LAL7_9ACTN|nr:L,D-transpeptidase family protein [Nocardiopsis eucommiae]
MKRRTAPSRTAAAVAALVLLASACTSEDGDDPGGAAAPEEVERGPEVEITPAPGATGVPPNTPVRVEAVDGTLTDVRVEQSTEDGVSAGDVAEEGGQGQEPEDPFPVTGTLNETGDAWVSDWNLRPGASVRVVVTAADEEGEESEVVSEFTTLESEPGHRLELASNFPSSGDVVGVGMPVIVNFDLPVTHKAQVENSIQVTAEEETEGAWNWVTDEMAVFRPKEYWDPYQEVTVDLRLAGVESSEGVYGVENHRIEFEVGRELVSTMHVPDHEMSVSIDGETVRTIPVSNGSADERFNTTTSGAHLTMEKYQELVMDSATVGIPEGSPGYYRLDVDWAVRTSNSGEFTHAAPWNAGNLGSANTSNGCTNMSVEDARWFHNQALMGDPLLTTGTDRELEWDNGWGFYQRSWEEWLSHSVTGEPQRTDGSDTPGSVHGEGL